MSDAWVATNKDGSEVIFAARPERVSYGDLWWDYSKGRMIILPKGSIKALIGRELSWESEPVQLTENNKE